ncbi:MAG: dUTP diphosphatase [Deltaproteobacteria bacterium]|nr:dUTP diphosphatase [Deltaproteobacteria bacterium]
MDDTILIKVRRVRPEKDADIPLPRYMTEHASGMDVHAAVDSEVSISPGEVCLVPTGLSVSIPPGFEFQIRPRSGLAVKHGIGIINAPGTIDADYRGEVCVALINFGKKPFVIGRGERIAQMVLCRVHRANLELADELDSSARNTGGFGHTGR